MDIAPVFVARAFIVKLLGRFAFVAGEAAVRQLSEHTEEGRPTWDTHVSPLVFFLLSVSDPFVISGIPHRASKPWCAGRTAIGAGDERGSKQELQSGRWNGLPVVVQAA